MVRPSESADSQVSPTEGLPNGIFTYRLAAMVHHAMTQDPRTIEALRELGFRVPEDIEAVRREPTFEAAQAKLAELQECVRKNFRQLAFELHPDRTGGDPEKTARFKALVQARDEIEKLRLRRPAPVQQHRVVMMWINPVPMRQTTATPSAVYSNGYASVGTSTATGSTVSPWQVAFIRPR